MDSRGHEKKGPRPSSGGLGSSWQSLTPRGLLAPLRLASSLEALGLPFLLCTLTLSSRSIPTPHAGDPRILMLLLQPLAFIPNALLQTLNCHW